MLIEKKMNTIIRKNAIVSIGTEGIVGNKVVNIIPAHQPAELAEEGDLLVSKNRLVRMKCSIRSVKRITI